MKELFSFLTRVPTKSKDLEIAAKHAYLFPLIGLIIGLMAYAVGYFSFTLLPNEIGASITTLSSILLRVWSIWMGFQIFQMVLWHLAIGRESFLQ